MLQAALVTGSAGYVLLDAAQRVMTPQPLAEPGLGVAIMLGAMVVTAGLVAFQRRVVQLTCSQAIAADRLHYTADLATNGAVILSLVVTSRLGLAWADPAIAVLIAGYLLWHALSIARGAVDTLMDRELPTLERERIKAIIRAHPAVVDLHDLRTREAGGTRFVEVHVEVDGSSKLRDVHLITDALEDEISRALPPTEAIIHPEPAGLNDARLDYRIARASARHPVPERIS